MGKASALFAKSALAQQPSLLFRAAVFGLHDRHQRRVQCQGRALEKSGADGAELGLRRDQSRGGEIGQQVTQILEQEFPGIDVELEEASGGRLSGRIVWNGFAKQDQADRQRRVRAVLKAALGPQVQQAA